MGYDWNHLKQVMADNAFYQKQMQELKEIFKKWEENDLEVDMFKVQMKETFEKKPKEIERRYGYKYE